MERGWFRSSIDVDAALRSISKGTACATGERFFESLVENLARVLGTHGAWVTEYLPERRRLRALAFWLGGELVADYEYDVAGTPCEPVIQKACLVNFPENVVTLFPGDPDLKSFGAVGYVGVPLQDVDGRILGNLAAVDTRPLHDDPGLIAVFEIFANRAAAELRRLRSEADVRERERKLDRMLASAMDAIVELDSGLRVTLMNSAGEKTLGCGSAEVAGKPFGDFLSPDSARKLERLVEDVAARPEGERSLWIPHGLTALSRGGEALSVEATLSRYDLRGRAFYILILRNVSARLEAERRIRSLTEETVNLREEIRALQQPDEIIGQSAALKRVLREVQDVAPTDATVLILGETGTGKELFARAIHSASRRHAKPLITVNCGAVPAALMESEFFGHEKGAFTGATQRREGRFALADRGTLFLDEIGELPPDLQVKLLRVLQEGEFQPVGSSHTRKVDVRVIAATNRDLDKAVQEGHFREDLYYRLNVFPIRLPRLRERIEDIGPLATAFAQRLARRLGRAIEPPSADCIRRLSSYSWLGNVRELQNVIERAVITSRDGRLNLDRALPEVAKAPLPEPVSEAREGGSAVITIQEMERLERNNLMRALETTKWRVAGADGAARLLGMNPSTLSSRLKALGIERPRR